MFSELMFIVMMTIMLLHASSFKLSTVKMSPRILELRKSYSSMRAVENSQNADSPPFILQFVQKIKSVFNQSGVKDKFTKENLAKMGLYALLSYGFVSNFSYISCVIIAWCVHGKRTGLSPLAPDQWKSFLLVYAGLFAANNVNYTLKYCFVFLCGLNFL